MAQPLNKIPGTVRLAKLLTHLNASPKLTLNGLKKLRLSFAMENDHFGARSVLGSTWFSTNIPPRLIFLAFFSYLNIVIL